MKKQIISLAVTFCWLVSLFLNSVSPVLAQDWQDLSSDIDRDGLPNEIEIAGWYNKAGGPFFTDPQDADSDDDGLTDGEEKLFDTIPVNGTGNLNGSKSPGIYVRYQDSYYTKEYFRLTDPAYLSMKQAGDRYLITEAMVARRGDNLHIGGPISGTLTVSGSGLGSLGVQKDPYAGGWNVTLPSTSGGRVGTYTATLTLAGEDPIIMPIYVIFEIPTPVSGPDWADNLSAGDIAAFLYNENPNDLRDETAVVWRTNGGSYSENGFTYRHAQGWAEAFWTDQYKKYVFVDHVMPRIHGQTNQNNATNALSNGADYEIRVDYDNYYKTEMYTTLFKKRNDPGWWEYCTKCTPNDGWWQDGTPCHSQAGVFTAFLRSAGIPARPFITDWSAGSYDTAVLIWFDNEWQAGRSYRGSESSSTYKYYPHNRGITADSALSYWDHRGNYAESNSEILVTANKDWDFEQWRDREPEEVCALGESGGYGSEPPGEECFLGGMVDTKFPPYTHQVWTAREFLWYSKQPLALWDKHPYMDTLNTIVWKGESWTPSNPPWLPDPYVNYTLPTPYPGGVVSENWPIEPVPQRCTMGYLGDCPYPPVGGLETSLQTSMGALDFEQQGISLPQIQTTGVQLGPIVNDEGLDSDGNGRFNELAIDVTVTVPQSGHYVLGGILSLPNDPTPYGGLYSNELSVDLTAGTQTVQLLFDGLSIGSYGINGPYQVTSLWISDFEDFDPRLGPWEEALATQQLNYVTASYTADQFESIGALLADEYAHYGLDSDGDGRYEAVNVDVLLDVSIPGTYQVEGDLYDGQDNFIEHAVWSGSGSAASLVFGLTQSTPPYKLQNLRLYDLATGSIADSRPHDAYTITNLGSQVDQGAVTMDIYLPSSDGELGIMGETITPTLVFSHTGVDLNSNGLYDQLAVDVQVQVSATDQYRVEGWLEAPDGSLLAYTLSDPVSLDPGLHSLSLPFNGQTINGQGVDGPYSVIALRILDGSSYDVLDEVHVTGLALDYDAADFEPDTEVASIFSDDMESGPGSWSSQSPWSRLEKVRPGLASYVWEAASSSQSGSLSISLDLSDYVNPLLRFKNTYQMASSSDAGYVRLSTNGVEWTTVATYTNATDRWKIPVLDLSAFEKEPNVELQFRANTASSLLWAVDDVVINGWPGLTDVSFDYSPKPVKVNEDVTFIASYSSIDLTLPVTYTWNFGDGTPPASGAIVIHQFDAPGDYLVQLTIESPYDSVTVSQLVGSGLPIESTSFIYEPLDPDTTTVISFTAAYEPITATNNITHPVVYEWNFGDSTTLTTTNKTITHTYSAGGNYPVQLTTSNGFGTAISNQVVGIKEGVDGVSFAAFGTLIEDDPVTFQTEFTPTTATQPISYTWDFGDGSPILTTTTTLVDHAFAVPATYTVTVTADNGYGSPAVYSDTVVIDGRPVSGASFTFTQTPANAEQEATFNGGYSPSNATQPVTYTWNFGDGSPTLITTTASITHQFPATDTYTVGLTVTNGYGPPVAYTQAITLPFDNDGDGLSNWYEWNVSNTDADDADTDDDGRTDGEEVNGYIYDGYAPHDDFEDPITTDPNDPDSDDDGMSDGDEFITGAHPGDPDTDDDGLLDGQEPGTHGTSSPVDPDSDDDGLNDGAEVNTHHTDPVDPDSDDDGLNDGAEVNTHHTDPLDPDSDDDGLNDGQEVNGSGTNPNNSDSDGDGIPDGVEVGNDPSNPLNTDSADNIDALDTDSDNDGIPDADEWDVDQNTSTSDDLCSNDGLDTDGDGIPNCQDNDADGDGVPNYRDDDTDGDGRLDADEGTDDNDDDQIPNFLDSEDLIPNAPQGNIFLPLIIKNK